MQVIAQTKSQTLADSGKVRPILTPRQKAAVIVRFLSSHGVSLPLSELSEDSQTLLTGQIAQMRPIDHETLREVVEEFCEQIESVGLTFPNALDEALNMLDGQLSQSAANRLRRMISSSDRGDPWPRISGMSVEVLLPILAEESAEVGAVLLSKLTVAKAADLLSKTPGEKARRIAYAVSLTSGVAPETVHRIGCVLAQQLDTQPIKAFESNAVDRVGAILNQSTALVRESLLEGLAEEDQAFADEVKKAIFTFALLPMKVEARDVPKILRVVEQPTLITALAASKEGMDAAAAEFILSNISQRMAASLREEMELVGVVKEKDGEAARTAVVSGVRDLADRGELFFISLDDEE